MLPKVSTTLIPNQIRTWKKKRRKMRRRRRRRRKISTKLQISIFYEHICKILN
jgi:hypothetical protein